MKTLLIGIAILALVGCASDTNLSNGNMTIPDLVNYDKDFRNVFADELIVVCGDEAKGLPPAYPKTCIFVKDQLELRARIKAIKGQ